MLRGRLGVSERWACQVVGQHRSTQRRAPTPAADDEALRAERRAFSAARPRWGYRQAHTHLQQQGWEINRKRVQRVWREEGLRVPRRTRKRRRLGSSTAPEQRLRAERPNHVWAFDFQFDQTADGHALKLLNVVDEFTREALVMHTARSRTCPGCEVSRSCSRPCKTVRCSSTLSTMASAMPTRSTRRRGDTAVWSSTTRPTKPNRPASSSILGSPQAVAGR
jgi:putative transposase